MPSGDSALIERKLRDFPRNRNSKSDSYPHLSLDYGVGKRAAFLSSQSTARYKPTM